MVAKYSGLIGTPYKIRDCYQIVVDFYRIVFNLELRNYYDEAPQNKDIAKNLIYSSMKDFKEVYTREFGDIVLIKVMGVESHIAVILDSTTLLHTTKATGCVVDRVSKWEKRIVGTYRVRIDI